MNRPILSQRVATAEEWRALSLRCAPERRDLFLRGGVPAYDDPHGQKRILPPGSVVTVALDPTAAVAKSDPTPMRTTTPAPVTSAAAVQRPRGDVSDLLEEFKAAGRSPEQVEAARAMNALVERVVPVRAPAEPKRSTKANDVSDLWADLEERAARVNVTSTAPASTSRAPTSRGASIDDLAAEIFGGGK